MPSDGASIARRTTAHTIRRRVPGRASTVEGTTSSMNCEASSNSVAACSWLPGGISGQRDSRSLTVANGNGSTVMPTSNLWKNLKKYNSAQGYEAVRQATGYRVGSAEIKSRGDITTPRGTKRIYEAPGGAWGCWDG